MSRERTKSFVLAILVMINFILGAKILSDKKLWPSGYNFFSFIENTDLYKRIKNQDKPVTKTHITMPQQIFVNTGDQTSRILIKPNEEIFQQIYSSASESIASALKAGEKNIRPAKKEEWVSALNGRSLYFSYAVEYDTRLFGEFFALDSSALAEAVPSFMRIIVTTDKTVLFEDFKSGVFYIVNIGASPKELIREIDSLHSASSGNEIINYSVDLKFDESLGSQTATLSPAAPVYSTPMRFPIVRAENPLLSPTGEIDENIVDKILSVFRINSNTVRRYYETSGTMVFVENNGILKIHPSGVISYQSTASSGFSLSTDNSYIDSVTALANFTDKITAAASADNDLYLSKSLSEKSTYVTFNYRSCGIPVNIDIDNLKHAVSAEIKNGSLISYTQLLRRYAPISDETFELQPFITALDNAVEKYSNDINNIEIQYIYPVYADNGTQSYYGAEWFTEIKSIIINEEEIR